MPKSIRHHAQRANQNHVLAYFALFFFTLCAIVLLMSMKQRFDNRSAASFDQSYNPGLYAKRLTPTVSVSPGKIVCADIFSPVCGKDGKTYSNACEAGAANQLIACEGTCPCSATTKPRIPVQY